MKVPCVSPRAQANRKAAFGGGGSAIERRKGGRKTVTQVTCGEGSARTPIRSFQVSPSAAQVGGEPTLNVYAPDSHLLGTDAIQDHEGTWSGRSLVARPPNVRIGRPTL